MPTLEGEGPSQPLTQEENPDFFHIGIQWIGQAKELHEGMENALLNICMTLGDVDPDQIIEEINRQPGPDVLHGKEEQILKLEKEWDDLQNWLNWTEGELSVAR